VEGDEIPYLLAASSKKKENFANRLKLDLEIKCYMPRVPRARSSPKSCCTDLFVSCRESERVEKRLAGAGPDCYFANSGTVVTAGAAKIPLTGAVAAGTSKGNDSSG